MQIKILAFGITKDIIGGADLNLEVEDRTTIAALKEALGQRFPRFNELKSLAIAINNEYAEAEQVISPNDEVVLIPPVSGG